MKTKTIDRIAQFIEEINISHASFDANVGLSRGYIHKAITNKINLGSHIIEKIFSQYPNLSAEWVISGKGEMFKSATNMVAEPSIGSIYGINYFEEGIIKILESERVKKVIGDIVKNQ